VANTEIERHWRWEWTGKEGMDTTMTDSEGRFSFPEVTGRSLTAGILPHQPVIHQDMYAKSPSGKERFYRLTKKDYDLYGEVSIYYIYKNLEYVPHPIKLKCLLIPGYKYDHERDKDIPYFADTCMEDRAEY
jgi:hypothetical protein